MIVNPLEKGMTKTHYILSRVCCVCSDALHNLVPFVLFKKRDRGDTPHRGVILLVKLQAEMKPATLLKLSLLHGYFHVFQIVQMVTNRAKSHMYLLNFRSSFLVRNIRGDIAIPNFHGYWNLPQPPPFDAWKFKKKWTSSTEDFIAFSGSFSEHQPILNVYKPQSNGCSP